MAENYILVCGVQGEVLAIFVGDENHVDTVRVVQYGPYFISKCFKTAFVFKKKTDVDTMWGKPLITVTQKI